MSDLSGRAVVQLSLLSDPLNIPLTLHYGNCYNMELSFELNDNIISGC